jgi:hypothetical protein
MATPTEAALNEFWEFLHAALGLQHSAGRLATEGRYHEASLYERQAIALLLEATCLLDTEEPALTTVRQLAAAGLSRLHRLKRKTEPRPAPARRATDARAPRRRRRTVLAAER